MDSNFLMKISYLVKKSCVHSGFFLIPEKGQMVEDVNLALIVGNVS